MNMDDIRRMAQEAGFLVDEKARGRQPNCIFHTHHMIDELLERFAALVEKHAIAASMPAIKLAMAEERKNGAAEERLACAQIALQWDKEHPSTNFGGCIARSIRARGQA
jgi:hypothetical protein